MLMLCERIPNIFSTISRVEKLNCILSLVRKKHLNLLEISFHFIKSHLINAVRRTINLLQMINENTEVNMSHVIFQDITHVPITAGLMKCIKFCARYENHRAVRE